MFKIISILFLINSIRNTRESGFQKDLNVDIPFPPILDRRDGIPTGHLRPLGWQNRAEAPVHEESVSLEPEKFWDTYINKSKPTVIRGLVLGSDAVERWTDIYLNRVYGHLDIKVAQRKQTFKSIEEDQAQMSLKKFLQGYRVEDWYLRGIMPEEMQLEAPVPHLFNCGPYIHSSGSKQQQQHESTKKASGGDEKMSKAKLKLLSSYEKGENKNKFELPKIAQLIEPYFWLSAGETSSLIHSHPEHNLHCVLDGRKDFILIPIDQFTSRTTSTNKDKQNEWRKMLDLVETYPHSSEWYSKIDVDMINAYKYKILSNTIWYWASLRAGDCIYIPANYLHQVRSHGRSVTSSVYFNVLKLDKSHEKQYDSIKTELFAQCSRNAPLFESMGLIKSHFLWTYTHSERHLNKKEIDLEQVQMYLMYLVRKDDRLYFESFEDFYNEITRELRTDVDTLVPSIKEYAILKASDYWKDLLAELTLDLEAKFITLERIINVMEIKSKGLDRFLRVLNIVAKYHDSGSSYRIKKDEL